MTQVRVSFPGRMGRQAQTQFGEYELKKMLGEGASGKVYLALDTYAGAEVTLKVIDARVLQDSEVGELTREQFMNEATLAGKLTHTHIVSILEAVMGEDSGYVAMGYALGDDLNRFTKPKSVTRRLARMTAVGRSETPNTPPQWRQNTGSVELHFDAGSCTKCPSTTTPRRISMLL